MHTYLRKDRRAKQLGRFVNTVWIHDWHQQLQFSRTAVGLEIKEFLELWVFCAIVVSIEHACAEDAKEFGCFPESRGHIFDSLIVNSPNELERMNQLASYGGKRLENTHSRLEMLFSEYAFLPLLRNKG